MSYRGRLRSTCTTIGIIASVAVLKPASGLAPLQVWFDPMATISGKTSRPFHDMLFIWNFGDGSAVTWTTGGRLLSSNVDIGPLAMHVYQTAGTYTPTCIMTDGTSSTTWTGAAITVGSFVAPAAWATTNTILASSSGSFTCAGVTSPNTQNTGTNTTAFDDMVALANTAAASNGGAVRVLFRAGETFKASATGFSQYIKTAGGPVWFGTYDNSGPKVGGTAAIIQALATGGGAGFGTGVVTLGSTQAGFSGMNDVRLTDLKLDASLVPDTNFSYGLTFNGQWTDVCCVNVEFAGHTATGLDMNHARISDATSKSRGYTMPNRVGFTNCPQSGAHVTAQLVLNSWGYACGKYLAVMGCTGDARGDAQGSSHCLRVIQYENLICRHNSWSNPGVGRHSIKLHSDGIVMWAAGTGYVSTTNSGNGDFSRPTDPVGTGHQSIDAAPQIWRCTTSGTSGGTEPAWNYTAGSTTSDGSVVWTECTAAYYAGTTTRNDDVALRDGSFGNERLYSSRGVIGDNKHVGATSVWKVSVGAQDTQSYELCYDTLIEGDFWPAWGSSVQTAAYEIGAARNVTIRNILVDCTTGGNITVVIGGWRGGNNYATHNLWVYNNSVVCTATGNALAMVQVDQYLQSPVVRNNLFYNTSGQTASMVTGGTAHPSFPLVSDHNTDNVSTFATDPKFSGVLSAVAGWQITDPTSYTKNVGINVPVWQDFFGTSRVAGSMDIGASEQ